MTASPSLVVVGAGAAGLGAAITASRSNVSVVLLEQAPRIGGTVAHGLIHTLGGLHDSSGDLLNTGLPEELVDRLSTRGARKRRVGRLWTLSADPNDYQRVVESWVSEERNIRLFTSVGALHLSSTERVVQSVAFDHDGRTKQASASALVDCSGSASAVQLLAPAGVRRSGTDLAAGTIVRLRDVEPGALEFPRAAFVLRGIRDAVRQGTLRSICAHTWLDQGVTDDEVFLKFTHTDDDVRRAAGRPWPGAILDELVAFLRLQPAFTKARVSQVGAPTPRGGPRIVGDYCLSADDVRSARRFPDAAAKCAWPIEWWDAVQGARLEYLRDDKPYEIPVRSLKVSDWRNLWAAGKCLSADEVARASARIAGCCWATGAAAGHAATAGTE